MSRFPWSLALLLAPLPCLPACFAPDALNGDDDDGNDGQGDAETAEEDDSSASDDTGSSPSTTATTDAPGDESSAGEDDTDPSAADTGELPEGGHVAFVLEGELYVMAAQPEAQLRQLGPELDALAPGVDEDFIQLSSDGEWLLLSSERFDPQCAGYACLSVVPIDASVGEPVLRAGGEPIRMGSGNGAGITRGGDAIVFGAEGVNTRDLHYTHRDGDGWSDPVVLTANSPYPFNTMPRLDVNEQLVVFDCGPAPYGDEGTAICEVGIGGDGFRVVWTPDQVPTGGSAGGFLHHPSYSPDGGFVFEASWIGEQVWVLAPGAAEPVQLRADHNNDNAPCVLPDGRVVSLWLGREGSAGLHELEIKAADGSDPQMLLIERDISDVGLACGL